MDQPELALGGGIPKDATLRRALLRLAYHGEGAGAAGLAIDVTTAAGREAWADLLRAIQWIYVHASAELEVRADRIDQHALWAPVILPLAFTNGAPPRERMEVHQPESLAIEDRILAIEIRCIKCARWIHPIRKRPGSWGSLPLVVSCENRHRLDCSRSKEATTETQRVIRLIQGWADPRQPSIFESLEGTV